MKKIKKIVALCIGLSMTTSLLTGCSADGLALVKAFGKSKNINSMQSQTDISVKVTGSNMSEDEQETMDKVLPFINGMKLSVLAKVNQNKEKTISKVQEDFVLQFDQILAPMNMSVWANMDLSADKPVINEVVKFPALLSTQLPAKLKGKEYMSMNLDDMMSAPGMSKIDYQKLISFTKEVQPKFLDFMDKYSKQFNIATNYISYAGSESSLQDNKIQATDIYELKLTDKSFKELMHYTLNNLAGNADAMSFVKDCMSSIVSIYGLADTESSLDEINKGLDEMTAEVPQALASLNEKLDSIDNLKILGDNGITIRYAVSKDGYIVKQSGKAEFVVDLPSIIKLSGESASVSDPTGIYTIDIDFNTNITNINKDVAIVFPTLDESNSFNFTDMVKTPVRKSLEQ